MVFAILSVLPSRRRGRWTLEDFKQDRANLLVFEDYADLSESEYSPAMRELLQSGPRIYESMVRQLYLLGVLLNKMLRLLYVSDGIFVGGLGLSVFSSLIVLLIIPAQEQAAAVPLSGL